MTPDWQSIAAQLHASLKAMPCRCDFLRNAAGVPLWFPVDGGGIDRRLTRQCSRCAALDLYDAAAAREAA